MLGIGLSLPSVARNRRGGVLVENPVVGNGALLNQYPNAAAAYSTRLLNTAYTGAALRVRRAADNAEVDVPFGANTALGTTDMEGFLQSYTGGFGTNLLLYSEEFDNAYWQKIGATISTNATESPISTLTADLVSVPASSAYVARQESAAANTCVSVFAKINSAGRYLWISRSYGLNAEALFDLQSGVVVTVRGGVTATISDAGGGFYRCAVGFPAGDGEFLAVFSPRSQAAATAVTASAASCSVFLWGAQVNAGLTPTTYDYKRDTANTSAFVTTWYDQSGNARHATQTDPPRQPRIVNAGVVDKVNGRVSVVTVGTNQFLRSTGFTVSQPDTVFACANLPNNGSVFDSAGAVHEIYRNNTGTAVLGAGAELSDGAAGGIRSYFGLFNGASSAIGTNAGVLSVGNGGNNALSGITVLGNRAGVSASNSFQPELIIYSSDQSANRAAIESNIMSYFGIPRAGDTLSVNNNSDELATNGNGDTLGVA